MSLASVIAAASLRRRPGRALFALLGVSLGIAIVVAIFTVDYNTLLSAPGLPSGTYQADLEVRPKAGLEDPRAVLADVPGVLAATATFQNDGRIQVPGQSAGVAALRIVAVELQQAASMGLFQVEESFSGELGESPGVYLGRRTATALGLKPGDTVALARPPRLADRACVEGQMVERSAGESEPPWKLARIAGLLAFENLGRTSNGDLALVDMEFGRQLFDTAFIEPRFWVARDASIDLERTRAALRENFAYDLRAGAAIGQQADERAFRNGVRLAGMMALALGLFVIFHTLSMSLLERVREIGLLAALGASRGQIAGAFFLEGLALAGGAALLGPALGLGLAKLLLLNHVSSLGITSRVEQLFEIPWGAVSALGALGFAVALLGSVFPLLRARSTDPVAALRGENNSAASVARAFHLFSAILIIGILPVVFFGVVDLVGEESRELLGVILMAVGVLALLVGTPLLVPSLVGRLAGRLTGPLARRWPFAGLLASRSIARGAPRIAAAVAALALVAAAFVGLRGMTKSLWLETDRWAGEALEERLFVENLSPQAWRPVARALEATGLVESVLVGNHRLDAPFRILGLDSEQLAKSGPLASDLGLRQAFERGEGLIISRRLAEQRGLGVGDSVPVATPGSGVVPLAVLAVSDGYGYFRNPHERAYGVASAELLRRLFCFDIEQGDCLSIRLRPGADVRVVEAQLLACQAELGRPVSSSLRVYTGAQIRRWELDDIEHDFVVFDVILGLTALLAAMGVLNGQLLAALERSQELGVLRALGASGGQIAGSVLLEASVVGLLGGGLGALLGQSLVPVAVQSLQVLSGLELAVARPDKSLLVALLGAWALALLAGLYPIWRMVHSDPVRAVRGG
jgi:putative ABC transport system permease protein